METEDLWRKVADMILMTMKYPMLNIAIKCTLEENGELINSVYLYTDDDEEDDRTLLMIACMHYDTECSLETVTMLLKMSNVNQHLDDGYTALHLAMYYMGTKKNMTRVIELLIINGADINLKDAWGDTVMNTAGDCYDPHSDEEELNDSVVKKIVFLVNTLLDHGGDPFIVNNSGITPYMNIHGHLNYGSPNPELLMLIKRMDKIRISEIIRDVENRQRISEIIKTDELMSGTIMGFRWI